MKFGEFLKDAVNVVGEALEEEQKKRHSQEHGGGSNNYNGNTAAPAHQGRASDMVNDLDDGANIPLSSCTGNKKSLFVGINYHGSRGELRGCLNDVKNIKKFVVEQWKFPSDAAHMRTLTDEKGGAASTQPTKQNMLAAFKWLVEGAKSGDSLFFHYSGHGGSQKDTDSDEADGMDETLIPVDYEKNGIIVDDDIHAMLVAGLPAGVRLTAIMDCCHSGSVMDLPYTYTTDGNLEIHEVDNRKQIMDAAISAGMKLVRGDKKGALIGGIKALSLYATKGNNKHDEEAKKRQIEIRSAVADVIQFSGCKDEQTSADASIGGQATGAMSWSFIKAFEEGGHNQTYVQLLGRIRKLLSGKYTQIPQMSSGHRMDMKTTFTM